MNRIGKQLSPSEAATAKAGRLEAQHLQEIEGNPLDAGQIAMFEMFERERWTHERRIAHIQARVESVATDAAE